MDEYLLIMRHEDGNVVATPAQIQVWMKATGDWIATIAAQNKFVGGYGLPFEDSRIVHFNKKVTSKPFGRKQETIGGIIHVKADSMDEAVEFAKGCPVLQGKGNTMEVRKIKK